MRRIPPRIMIDQYCLFGERCNIAQSTKRLKANISEKIAEGKSIGYNHHK